MTAIDVVRGAALFGVMAVNLVEEFRVSIFAQFAFAATPAPLHDVLATVVVRAGLQGKAFSLFSLLFGVSMAILCERLSRSGRPLYYLSRRLAALLAFGLAHLLFIWNGDILTEYAVAGCLALPLMAASTRVLAGAAVAALVAYLAMPFPPLPALWPTVDGLREHAVEAVRVYASGSYADICRFSLRELPMILALHVYVFPRTVALLLLGAVAWRGGLFDGTAASRRVLAGIAIAGCAVGGAFTLAEQAGASLAVDALGPFRHAIPKLAPVMLALGYGAALVALVQSRERGVVAGALAPIGRMAFTNYILQSVIFSLIFFGYGLGLFGRLGAFVTLLLGVAVFAAQCGFSALWLSRYRYGPLEWLWRTATLGRRPPFVRR